MIFLILGAVCGICSIIKEIREEDEDEYKYLGGYED